MPRPLLQPLLPILLLGLVASASGMGLDQAVAKVREQTGGRVLSAQTLNRVHQIRVLTPSGQVRLIRIPADGKASNPKQGR
ncbi:ribosome biogenesis GTPase RsgA [Magnetovirga frankeli]|nr:ribosome biogenesis GTPase RsgA [gamma proteobacterium SS-5]